MQPCMATLRYKLLSFLIVKYKYIFIGMYVYTYNIPIPLLLKIHAVLTTNWSSL